jgi:hypothetical protein
MFCFLQSSAFQHLNPNFKRNSSHYPFIINKVFCCCCCKSLQLTTSSKCTLGHWALKLCRGQVGSEYQRNELANYVTAHFYYWSSSYLGTVMTKSTKSSIFEISDRKHRKLCKTFLNPKLVLHSFAFSFLWRFSCNLKREQHI